MATQEERIQELISRLQGAPQGVGSSFTAPPAGISSSLSPGQVIIPPTQAGSFLDITSATPMQQPVTPATPPPPMPEPQTALDLFKAFDSPFLPEIIEAPSQLFEGTDDSLYAVPRGITRGALQTGLSMAEGLFSIADTVTSLAGYEDAIDRDTSEFFKDIQEAKEYVGNEEGMVGKLMQGVGSIFAFALPGLGQAAAGTRAAALLASGPGKLNASKRMLALSKGLAGVKYAAAGSAGAGQSSAMLEAFKQAGGDYTVGQRNLAIALGVPIGFLELLAPEMVLRGIPRGIANQTKSEIIRRLGEAGTTGVGEGAQEAFSQVLQEFAAQVNYNPDIEIGESMLSDFGYGAGAGAIFDLLVRGKVKYPKNEQEIREEYQQSTPLAPLSDEFVGDAIANETELAVYDADGQQLTGQIVGVEGGDAKVLIGEEIEFIPLDQTASETGFSFASDADLLTPRYKIDGRDVGDMTLQELEQQRLAALSEEITAKKATDIKAIDKEIQRRNPLAKDPIDEGIDLKQKQDEEGAAIDSGEIGDAASQPNVIDDTIEQITGEGGDDVLTRIVQPDAGRYQDIEQKAIDDAFKRNKVGKKAQPKLIEEVAGREGATIADLDNKQKFDLLNKVENYQANKKAEKEREEALKRQQEADKAAEAEEIKRLLEQEAAQEEAQQRAEQPPEVITEAPEVTPEVTPEPAPEAPEPTITPFSSKIVEDSKPRYRTVTPVFESQLDKALYIVGNTRSRSAADSDIMTELRRYFGRGAPGFPDSEIRRLGMRVRESVKERGEPAFNDGLDQFNVPEIITPRGAVKQEQAPEVTPQPEVVQEVPAEPEITPEPEVTPEPEAAPRVRAKKKATISRGEKEDLVKLIDTLLISDKTPSTALQGLAIKLYNQIRQEGRDHDATLLLLQSNQDLVEAAAQEDDLNLDFMRKEQPAAAGVVQGQVVTQTPQGPGIVRSRAPLDINDFNRVKQIVNSVAPQANLVVASQLFGPARGDGANLNQVEIDGKNYTMEEALGLQAGNVVAVSLADGYLDPQNRAYHEATHFLFNNNFLTAKEKADLAANVERLQQIVSDHLGAKEYERAFSGLTADQKLNELVAYGSALYNRGLDIDGKVPKEFTPGLRRVFAKILRLFKQLQNAFSGEGRPAEIETIFEEIRQGRVGRREPQVSRSMDSTGLSSNTPLYMIKQGPAAAATEMRPKIQSRLLKTVNAKSTQKALPEAWARVVKNKQGNDELVGILKGVKLEEYNDSHLAAFLSTAPQDKAISGAEIAEYLDDIQGIVEIQVYGTPIDRAPDDALESDYQAALQEDRNNLAYEQIARQGISELRRGIPPDESMTNTQRVLKSYVNTVSNGNPNNNQATALPKEVLEALNESLEVTFKDKQNAATKKLAKALTQAVKDPESGLDRRLLGQIFVENDYHGRAVLKDPQGGEQITTLVTEPTDISLDPTGATQGIDPSGEFGDNFYYAYTAMGGREIPEQGDTATPDLADSVAQNYREIVLSMPLLAGRRWHHAHFPDIPNPLMHMRVSDIVLENGDLVMVIEEIQSDLHQAAQTHMKSLAATKLHKQGEIRSPNFDRLNREDKQKVRKVLNEFKDEVYGSLVPDLPLKQDNQRLAFGIDILTKMAVRNGYDHIAISNSELQNERYRNSVRNHISGLALTSTINPQAVKFDDVQTLGPDQLLFTMSNEDLNDMKSDLTADQIDFIAEEGLALQKEEVNEFIKANTRLLFPEQVTEEDATFASAAQLGGLPLSEGTIQVQEQSQAYAQEEALDLNTAVDIIFNRGVLSVPNLGGGVDAYPDRAVFNLSQTNARFDPNFRSDLKKTISREFDPSIGSNMVGILRLSFAQALAKKYPFLPRTTFASYTVPAEGFGADGQYYEASFYRDTIALEDPQFAQGDSQTTEDWLGENISKVVMDSMGDNVTFNADDFVGFVRERIEYLNSLKEKKDAGLELTAQEMKSESLLDVAAIRQAKNRVTGAVDLPVGSGFENVYDVKMPQQIIAAMARLGSESKKAIKEANKNKRVYLGTGDLSLVGTADFIDFQEASIVDVSSDPAASLGDRTIPIGTGTATEAALRQQIVDTQIENRMREDEGEGFGVEDIPNIEGQYAIRTSPQRNQLQVFEITDSMRESDQLSEASEVYFARKQDERVAATNEGTNNLRGVFRNGRQAAIDFIDRMPFFNTLKGLPDKRELVLERAKYLGTVQRSSDVATFLRDEIGNKYLSRTGPKNRQSTEQLRTAIFEYLTTGEPEAEAALFKRLEALDSRAAAASSKAKDLIENLGLELVNAGLLPAKTYYKRARSYLPRIYIKHVLENKIDPKFGYLKARDDQKTPEAMEALGVINELDPAFLVSRAIQRPIRDLQFIEFMNSISENKNWTTNDDQFLVEYGPANEDGSPRLVSGFYLLNEVTTLNDIADALEDAQPERAAKLRQDAQDMKDAVMRTFEERGLKQFVDDQSLELQDSVEVFGQQYKRVSRNKQYGLLAGRLVREEIYDDLVASSMMMNIGDPAYVEFLNKGKKLTAIWKTIKVPLNPPTIARNTFSNAILIHLSGVPFYRVIPRMVEAAREIIAYRNKDFENSRHYQELLKRGVKQSSFTEQELIGIQDDMMDFLKSVDAKDIGMFGWLKLNTWGRLSTAASNMYQGLEVIGKTAIAIDVMERQGGTADDAFLKAQEYLFDYGDVPQLVRATRQSPIGIPFLTFQYKVLPILAKTALRNPARFAPYVALSYALPAAFMSLFDIDDDDYEDIKNSMPDYIRGNPGLVPLPTRDDNGRLQFLDTSYLYPWGSLISLSDSAMRTGKQIAGVKNPVEPGFDPKDMLTTVGMFGGPAWSLFGATVNLDPFTQRPIVNPDDPFYISGAIERPFYRRGQLTDAMFWAANQYVLPGFLNTEYGAVSKLNSALRGGKKASGVPVDTLDQALMRLIGLNITSVDPTAISASVRYLASERNKILAARSRVVKDQSLSREERRRRVANYNAQLESFSAKYGAILEAARNTRAIDARLRREDKE